MLISIIYESLNNYRKCFRNCIAPLLMQFKNLKSICTCTCARVYCILRLYNNVKNTSFYYKKRKYVNTCNLNVFTHLQKRKTRQLQMGYLCDMQELHFFPMDESLHLIYIFCALNKCENQIQHMRNISMVQNSAY